MSSNGAAAGGGRAARGSARDDEKNGEYGGDGGEDKSSHGIDFADGQSLDDLIGAFNMMELSDEMLVRIMMAYDVTHGSLAFVKTLKQTN